MICTIYRSSLREQTYLYIEKKNDFSRVPADLLKSFGKPQLAMTLSLANREKLAFADINKVRVQLTENGYYLQVPPAAENLLSGHLKTRHHSL